MLFRSINGYTFYTEAQDRRSVYQNSGVILNAYENLSSSKRTKFYGVIEEIWVLDYTTTEIPMFRVRWAEKVETKDNFTTMVIPKKSDEKENNKKVSAAKEPWVLAKQVVQCFYIADPLSADQVVVRRGKRSIIGVDGVVDEEDYNQFDDPDLVVDEAAVCIPPPVPWQRRIENIGRAHV